VLQAAARTYLKRQLADSFAKGDHEDHQQLKRFRLIQKTLFEEIMRRESGYLLPKSKE
jgi:hypothetical protein